MSPESNPVELLQQSVTRLLKLVSSGSGTEIPGKDVEMLRRLEQQLADRTVAFDPAAEREFFWVINRNPRLRHLYSIVFQEELLAICHDGIHYYTDLMKRRELSSSESEQFQQVEETLEDAREELNRLRRGLS